VHDVFVIGALGTLWLRPRLSVETREAAANCGIAVYQPSGFGIKDFARRKRARQKGQYIAMVGSVSVFILLANLLSVFPAFSAPTAEKTVPLAAQS